jgi:outer membrane receptor protein involved in Fe transport
VISGVRAEFTGIGGSYESGEQLASNQYSNILPNITISRSLKNFRTLKLSYNQRIQRPSLFYINPFVNSADNYNIVIGNPSLTPEKTHQVELSYNSFFKGFALFGSVFYKYGEDIIQSIVNVNSSGVSENSYYNIGTNNSFGVNLFGSKSINRFTLRGGGNVNTYNYASSDPEVIVSNPFGFVYLATLNGSYSFPFDLKIDAFGFFRSSERTIQGTQPSFSIFGMGFKKDFPKLKASVGLRVIEPFFENKVFESKQRGNGFYQESSFSIPFRSIGFNLEYKFGEVKFKERKSAIKNQDLKQENSNNGGAGGGGAQ